MAKWCVLLTLLFAVSWAHADAKLRAELDAIGKRVDAHEKKLEDKAVETKLETDLDALEAKLDTARAKVLPLHAKEKRLAKEIVAAREEATGEARLAKLEAEHALVQKEIKDRQTSASAADVKNQQLFKDLDSKLGGYRRRVIKAKFERIARERDKLDEKSKSGKP